MTPTVKLYQGDCLDVMPMMAENSIDSIVTDPPYGLSFMGKNWDHGVPGVPFWEAALRVAKPGAMLLAFGGTRTHHRLMVAIEDAGWEIRDCLMWLYGSGFPKSLDIGKAIDKAAGAEREVVGRRTDGRYAYEFQATNNHMGQLNPRESNVEKIGQITAPATDAAKQWDGWGTALKPAYEPIILAMKPLDGTFANNALKWGVAGINVDASRIGTELIENGRKGRTSPMANGITLSKFGGQDYEKASVQGRWPANVLLDEESAALLDEQSGVSKSTDRPRNNGEFKSVAKGYEYAHVTYGHNDQGGASRFFYVAKASKRDRDEGLEGMPERENPNKWGLGAEEGNSRKPRNCTGVEPVRNHHPTVKPTQLMRYLVRLVTPPGGTVFDPFLGSGSTLKAAKLEGFNGVGIELDAEYLAIAQRRIDAMQPEQAQLPLLEITGDDTL